MAILKQVISPVQAWLLSQGKCVGCGMPLSKGKKDGKKVTCNCGRIYIVEGESFRRARFEEV